MTAMMPKILIGAMPVSPLDNMHPAVKGLRPYTPGRSAAEVAKERGIDNVVKLASNENPLGPGSLALDVLRAMNGEMFSRYPPGGAKALTTAIAARWNIGANRVILGNGSNDILALAAQLMLCSGGIAVYSRHSFLVYGLAAAACGADVVVVDAEDKTFAHDLDKMAKAAKQNNVRLVFVANPNNPTGTWHPPDAIRAFLQQIPANVLVVLDEAYCDYLDDGGDSSLPLIDEFDNLLITRTFSKMHGLAGLRAGYGIGNERIINALNTIRQPFNINIAAQTAALAALQDNKHLTTSKEVNNNGMKTLRAAFDDMGVKYLPSYANFLSFAAANDNMTAAQVYERLLDNGIIVRRLDDYQMADYLRITIGAAEENNKFIAALTKIIQR